MSAPDDISASSPAAGSQFHTTHWSVVLSASRKDSAHAAEALEKLCRTYWYPLYAYIRRRGHDAHEAEDLTQEFFTRLLEKNSLAEIKPEGGKFRSYLLTLLKHFLVNEYERHQAQKRGGGQVLFSLEELEAEQRYQFEPVDQITPEILFERCWAAALLDQVMSRLRAEYVAHCKTDLFEKLRPCLTGADGLIAYAELASQLDITENALKMTVYRLRKRYGELVRAEIALVVSSPAEIEQEIRCLIAAAAE
jgi:RNA polymerase sigma-70 factor (ECF subfamily)